MEAANRPRRAIALAAIVIGAAAILGIGLASRDAATEPEATGYLPSISDLMIATIQPRHERLWRAGQDGNWDFAAYELGNLNGAFNRLGHAHPTQGGISLPDMITVTEQPFKELRTAIQSKDGAAFAKAYVDLTDACNSCHQALNHGVVKIRVPNRASTSDLDINSGSRN
jgi:hypothetical protein